MMTTDDPNNLTQDTGAQSEPIPDQIPDPSEAVDTDAIPAAALDDVITAVTDETLPEALAETLDDTSDATPDEPKLDTDTPGDTLLETPSDSESETESKLTSDDPMLAADVAAEIDVKSDPDISATVTPPAPELTDSTESTVSSTISTVSTTEETLDSAAWDDDLSPELAAVLFADSPVPEGDPTLVTPSEPTPTPDPTPAATITATVADESPALPAEIHLTDVTDARQLPLAAEGHNAPAPDATLTGKVRYMRIEEPLGGDKGQRTRETWKYFKPDYPSLDGRLVKEVRTEEITHADGSWRWRYDRRYTDRQHDRREVRVNSEHTYFEREDEVSKIDPSTGKRGRYTEHAALIFAEPESDDKRGFLGTLLGRDDDDDATEPKVWREATSSEKRHARKHGGTAVKRGWFRR